MEKSTAVYLLQGETGDPELAEEQQEQHELEARHEFRGMCGNLFIVMTFKKVPCAVVL